MDPFYIIKLSEKCTDICITVKITGCTMHVQTDRLQDFHGKEEFTSESK